MYGQWDAFDPAVDLEHGLVDGDNGGKLVVFFFIAEIFADCGIADFLFGTVGNGLDGNVLCPADRPVSGSDFLNITEGCNVKTPATGSPVFAGKTSVP